MSTTTKVLRTLAVIGLVGGLAAFGVFSAFSSATDNSGNEVTAGTVTLTDNDAGGTLYDIDAAKPGDSEVSCIRVAYSGSLDAAVKLYTPSTIGDLGSAVNLKIEPGTQLTPSFPSCTGFIPDGAAIFNNTLASFASSHSSYANGLADNPGNASEWAQNDAVVYRVTATLDANAPDTAQGDSTGSHTLRWEARNN